MVIDGPLFREGQDAYAAGMHLPAVVERTVFLVNENGDSDGPSQSFVLGFLQGVLENIRALPKAT
jgi:hypothetical protein